MPDLMPWGAGELSKLKDNLDKRVAALCEDFGLIRTSFPEGVARVAKQDGEWVIVCPLPGFEPEDVAVTVTGRLLSIVAERKRGSGEGLVRVTQELSLPFPIDQARANLEDGVLTVRLARQAPPEARAIPVVKSLGGEECPPSIETDGASEPARTDETTTTDRSTR